MLNIGTTNSAFIGVFLCPSFRDDGLVRIFNYDGLILGSVRRWLSYVQFSHPNLNPSPMLTSLAALFTHNKKNAVMKTETKLNPEFEKTLSSFWNRGEFDIHYNALSNIAIKRPDVLDELSLRALKSMLSDMDIFRAAKVAGESA